MNFTGIPHSKIHLYLIKTVLSHIWNIKFQDKMATKFQKNI